MTNTTSILLGLVLVGIFAADLFYFHWDLHIFLGQQLMRLTDVIAIWR